MRNINTNARKCRREIKRSILHLKKTLLKQSILVHRIDNTLANSPKQYLKKKNVYHF